ncbi:MAG: 2-oxo acid dehydrogenase subunit E2 [Myxococcales bacterium]|nr:2-oxo acid dehydrogenase subunit E2 [Myxococcales bacterium]
MAEFLMPSLGADMDDGVLVEWLVKPGDVVKRGDIVAVVETQKGAIDVEIFEDGVIGALLVAEGTKVPVGAALATVLGDTDHAAPSDLAPRPVEPTARAPAATVNNDAKDRSNTPSVRASPRARRRAAELGVALADVRGTGPNGAVTTDDVEAAARSGVAARHDAAASASGPSEMRKAIASAMSRSKREIPHYYLAHTVDLGPLEAWRVAINGARRAEARLVPAALLLAAVARALVGAAALNGVWQEGEYVPATSVHLGVAVSLRGGGLVTPVIHDADTLGPLALMRRLDELVSRARAGRLRSSELGGGTVTVTNLGDRGVELVHGVIFPPQVALVGIGAVALRPWVVDGAVIPRPVAHLTLAADHRVSDGHDGARLLKKIERLLAAPASWAEEEEERAS